MTGSAAAGMGLYLSFAAVFALSVVIVWVAARRTRSAADYFVAGNRIGAVPNALALAGDFVGVGGFFAMTGLIALNGGDGFIFGLGAISGFPLMLFLFADPLRRLGRYTLADVLTTQLESDRPRTVVALTQLVAILAQLTAQLVGAMALLHLLFGLAPGAALALLGIVIAAYVLLGGMLATTWLQITKASLMIAIAVIMALKCLGMFGFDPLSLLRAGIGAAGAGRLAPGHLFTNIWDLVSLLIGMSLGNASMPHILMRMNTVKDPAAARRSVFIGTGIIVLFHLVILLLGFATMALVSEAAIRAADPGGNMALPLLAKVIGGDMLLGAISAIALATILAVVAGLVMAGSASLSHDLWINVVRRGAASPGEHLRTARIATMALIVAALGLAYGFRGQNLGFLSAMGYAVAASANFPVLLLTLFWRRLTPAGAIAGMATGVVTSLVLILLSPIVQIGVLHRATAIFPLQNPALVTVPLAFAAAILMSIRSAERA